MKQDNLFHKQDTKMKTIITYEVVSLPTNKERLSPQLLKLVETIDFLKEEVDGKITVDRDKVYSSWLEEINMESNDKVFSSYIHQLIQFSFLDRMNIKPKKTMEERKVLFLKQLSLMSKEDKELILKELV